MQNRCARRVLYPVLSFLVLASLWFLSPAVWAADWPMWRHDAGRSGATEMELDGDLHLHWLRDLPPLDPAWPGDPKLNFDDHYEPVVAGGRMFIGSPRTDRLTAYQTATGEAIWHFQADGPIRFAPAVDQDRVFFVSDDGYLYCVAADSGELIWKFRGGPSDRKVLGNHRLISTWPARGAPVVADDVVYFAASIWPFMGVFVHALDAETGTPVWTNDGDGSIFIKQPHDSNSFAGAAPQGPLVVAGEMLLVPSGRSVPECLDRRTGKLLYYHLAENKRIGGWRVAANERFFFNGGRVYDVTTGDALATLREPLVFDEQHLYSYATFDPHYEVFNLADSKVVVEEKKSRRGRLTKRKKLDIKQLAEIKAAGGDAFIKAGSRLYSGTKNQVLAVELAEDGTSGEVVWQADIEGTPARLLAADERLFVVTKRGRVYCFGPGEREPSEHGWEEHAPERDGSYQKNVAQMLESTGADKGYCICWGVGSGQLIAELLARSELHLIVVDPDASRVARLQDAMIAAGLYGRRVSAHVADPLDFSLPPYLANLAVSEDLVDAGFDATEAHIKALFRPLRPYGGVACLPLPKAMDNQIEGLVETAGLKNAGVERVGRYLYLSRIGALEGSANWTHEHADASNTRVSRDQRVKAPLGVLWFGGPPNTGVLPRHGHGPQPQVIDGRLIIEGVDMLRAVDIYNGTLLWQRSLKGLGEYYNNFGHQPGANGTGTNYVSTPDGLYVVYQDQCLWLDPDTGETLKTFTLPPDENDQPQRWGYINVVDDYLIGGADPLLVYTDDKGRPKKGRSENLAASKRLVAMDRHRGEVLWSAEAVNYFRHNAICAGGGRLYAVDLLSGGELARLKRRGEEPTTKSRLVALDLATGEEQWSTDDGVFGTWLSYSAAHDVLVESGRGGRDTLLDEAHRMRVFRAADGSVLWTADHRGPAMIHGDRILNQNAAFNLLTGEALQREDPITGEMVPWHWQRNYGCNTPVASANLLTFRSGAAGFFDLANDGGTGNFGGFRSGCTNNLIVAGGILNAPDYTRSCTCAYQNQSSLALIHMPEVEIWTEFPLEPGPNLKHLGLNLGAPGYRRAADGLLWLNAFDQATVDFDPRFGFFRRHSSDVLGGGLAWVAASGCRGIKRIVINPRLDDSTPKPVGYTVRLHFCDPDNDKPGQRVFKVSILGQVREPALDIVARAGGRNREVVRTYSGIEVRGKLAITFAAADGADDSNPARVPLVCGVEVLRETP